MRLRGCGASSTHREATPPRSLGCVPSSTPPSGGSGPWRAPWGGASITGRSRTRTRMRSPSCWSNTPMASGSVGPHSRSIRWAPWSRTSTSSSVRTARKRRAGWAWCSPAARSSGAASWSACLRKRTSACFACRSRGGRRGSRDSRGRGRASSAAILSRSWATPWGSIFRWKRRGDSPSPSRHSQWAR